MPEEVVVLRQQRWFYGDPEVGYHPSQNPNHLDSKVGSGPEKKQNKRRMIHDQIYT